MTPRGYLNLALLLLGGALLWWAGDSLYDAGVSAERGRWESAAAKAAAEDRKAEQSATTASESIGDQSRAEAAAEAAAISQETGESLSRIEYVYLNTPAAALPCTADGRPAPLPDGVLLELDQAVEAFNGAAATAR